MKTSRPEKMTLDRYIETGGQGQGGTWIHARVVAVDYDGMVTFHDRRTGKQLYHGPFNAVRIWATLGSLELPADAAGEVYTAYY